MENIILVAGATGNLGERIVKALLRLKADVRVIVRASSNAAKISHLENMGAQVFIVNNWNKEELTVACKNCSCVVSALAGLEETIIGAQKILLDAAIEAGVLRFIPSDYSLDFTSFRDGENRNLDLRRKFHVYLDSRPIASTTIFNGAFADLLKGEMPMIFLRKKLVLHWGNADRKLAFTTMDNTAEFTAHASLDRGTPRYLHIAGDQVSARDVKTIMIQLTGHKFRMIRTGGQHLLGLLIKIARAFSPGKDELYPAWQGMQYMHNMIDDRAQLSKPDNDRYPGMHWTSIQEMLKAWLESEVAAKK
ncbi:MAG: NmrA family protein [Ferruginibacter sp.]|nr:NmrA family protein [Ferruginibacter sp.]